MENFQDRGVWIRIRFVLRGWIRSISDRIRNPAHWSDCPGPFYWSKLVRREDCEDLDKLLNINTYYSVVKTAIC